MAELPSIKVFLPQPHEPNRGVHSTGHNDACRVVVRMNAEIRTALDKGAAMLQISLAEFIRAASYNMARALIQQEKDNGTDTGNRG